MRTNQTTATVTDGKSVSKNGEELKEREKEFFDSHYDVPLSPVTVEEVWRTELQPCYEKDSIHHRTDNLKAFQEVLDKQWENKVVLDYACGDGTWSIYLALLGAQQVSGFDLAETAIARGRERVAAQELKDKVQLDVGDATNLQYADRSFEIVIGYGVMHHVIKYPRVFEELYRVMKPGAKAYFGPENLADFPLFRLWWRLKGEVAEGDVPIFANVVREKAHMFSNVEIIGDTFFYSIKRFLWKKNPGIIRRSILRTTRKADELLFSLFPSVRRWGGMCYIVLTKSAGCADAKQEGDSSV